jgi:hypothetical protein
VNAAIHFNASNKTVISVTYFYQFSVIMVFLDLQICHVASLVAPFYYLAGGLDFWPKAGLYFLTYRKT